MSIVDTDLEYYKSSQSISDGGTITATAIVDATLDNLFDAVSSTESSSGLTDYRKCFIKNNHATLTWQNVVFWRSINTTSIDDEIWVGLGTADDDDGSVELTAFSSGAKVALTSDGADTRNVTIIGEVSGVRTSETVALDGTNEVLSTNTYDAGRLYLVYPASTSASRTITIKQGTGGTSRGTIAPNKKSAILYLNVSSKVTGILLGNIAPAGSQGLWLKRIVGAGAGAVTNNQGSFKCEGETS